MKEVHSRLEGELAKNPVLLDGLLLLILPLG